MLNCNYDLIGYTFFRSIRSDLELNRASDHYQSDDEVEPVIIRKKRKRHDRFCETIKTIIILDEVPVQEVNSGDEKGFHLSDDDINDDELFFDEDEVDLFATPDSLNFNYDSDQEHPNTNTNMNDLWILL